MGFKSLLATPLVFAVVSAAIDGRSPETQLLHWAVYGSAAGSYASAAWEMLPALGGAEMPRYWRALAALRISISFCIGLFLSLGIASYYGMHWHHWTIACLAFVLALSGSTLRPVIARIVTRRLDKIGGDQ